MQYSAMQVRTWIRFYFWLMSALGMGALAWTAAIPADEKGAVLWGFSAARLTLLSGILVLVLMSVYAGWFAARNEYLAKKIVQWLGDTISRLWMMTCAGLFVLVGWLAAFMPAYWFRIYQFYFVRLQPLLVWLGLGGLILFLMLGLPGFKVRWQIWKSSLKSQKGFLRAAGIAVGVFAVVWLIAATTGLGIIAEPYFWDEASVPLLAMQIVLCAGITVLLERWVFSSGKLQDRPYLNWVIFFSLWMFAFLLWFATPLKHSYFAPGPRPPNYLFYPYSDAEFYDLAAQYILLGQGVFNGIPMDKPLYAMLLALFHAVVGQGYEETINLQIAVLALMPAVLYGLGCQMINRPAGVLMGLLAAFHQRNAIAATPYIKVSHSKLYLTEYPTALLLVIFALFAFRWLKGGQRISWVDAVLAGGFLGLAMLVRPNALMVLPFVLLLAWLANRKRIKKWLLSSGVIVLMVTITVLPFMLEIPRGFNEPYLIIKIRAILESRILTDEPRGVVPLERQLAADERFNDWGERQSQNGFLEGLERFAYVPRHFFHNMIMTVMLLPNTFALHDLRHTLEAPYWKDVQQWTGELPPGGILFLPINLIVLALGVGAAWQRNKAAGLVPLMMVPGYFLANSLARNSGWRYLAPMDWVVLVYFAIGWLVLLRWALDWLGIGLPQNWLTLQTPVENALQNQSSARSVWKRSFGFGFLFLLIGLWLPLNKVIIPDYFSPQKPSELLRKVREAGLQLDGSSFEVFMNSPNHYINEGKGFYPRFYPADGGEPQPNLPLKGRPYPRFTITIVGWDTFYTVLLPMEEPMPYFPHGEDVLVIGCRDSREPFIDAYAMVVLSDPPQVYQRSVETELVCPFPPVAETP